MRALVLNNIRSAENVGSMLRSADAFGIDLVYLCGYTPAPRDRFGRPVAKLIKASLGAEVSVRWERIPDALAALKALKRAHAGLKIIALEQDARSVSLKKMRHPSSFALVVGNEVEGVVSALLDAADSIVEIPMRGAKESLNVAVATGIALHHLAS